MASVTTEREGENIPERSTEDVSQKENTESADTQVQGSEGSQKPEDSSEQEDGEASEGELDAATTPGAQAAGKPTPPTTADAPLLFFLLFPLFLELFQLRLRDLLSTTLSLQTPSIMTVRRCIDIEEGIHLPLALVLIVEVLRVQISNLISACESIEGSSSCILSSRVYCLTRD